MKYDFNRNLPIYIQVMDEIKKKIFNGSYLFGTKIDSVRDLALEYGVNPNTVQKALSELEREGLLYSKRSSGRFVSEDIELIENFKKEIIVEKIKIFVKEMEELGYSKEEIIKLIEELKFFICISDKK